VAPFVPLEDTPLAACIELAHQAGEELWRRLRVPVYFYGEAARLPERRRLENIRRGEFEGLRAALPGDATRHPDVGGPELHPTAGATAVGVRGVLLAFNIDLATQDLSIARRIARSIRESSGGLPAVKALGLELPTRHCTQVSMNLTDFERTPPHVVFEEVRRRAEALGVKVLRSEIIGLAPRKALEMAAAHFLQIDGFKPDLILENRLEQAHESYAESSAGRRAEGLPPKEEG
jgi:glutamate formiminotransferase